MSQEIGKGSNLLKSTLLPNTQAGWRFHFQNATGSLIFPPSPPGYFEWDRNPAGGLVTRMLRPSETTSITPSQLKTTPFHWPFEYPKLYDTRQGSAEAMRKEVQYDLLATAIPAMSW